MNVAKFDSNFMLSNEILLRSDHHHGFKTTTGMSYVLSSHCNSIFSFLSHSCLSCILLALAMRSEQCIMWSCHNHTIPIKINCTFSSVFEFYCWMVFITIRTTYAWKMNDFYRDMSVIYMSEMDACVNM